MKNLLQRLVGYKNGWESSFDNKGFLQGIGFNVKVKALHIFGLRFITEVEIDGTSEWLRDLKKRWEEDDKQQKRESQNIKS